MAYRTIGPKAIIRYGVRDHAQPLLGMNGQLHFTRGLLDLPTRVSHPSRRGGETAGAHACLAAYGVLRVSQLTREGLRSAVARARSRLWRTQGAAHHLGDTDAAGLRWPGGWKERGHPRMPSAPAVRRIAARGSRPPIPSLRTLIGRVERRASYNLYGLLCQGWDQLLSPTDLSCRRAVLTTSARGRRTRLRQARPEWGGVTAAIAQLPPLASNAISAVNGRKPTRRR
jgi:hypothetical protein